MMRANARLMFGIIPARAARSASCTLIAASEDAVIVSVPHIGACMYTKHPMGCPDVIGPGDC